MTAAFEVERALLLAALVIGNVPVYALAGLAFFGTLADFRRAGRGWLRPDIGALLRGDDPEAFISEIRLFFWGLTCVAAVALQYAALAGVHG